MAVVKKKGKAANSFALGNEMALCRLLAEGYLVYLQHLLAGAGAGVATGANVGHGGVGQSLEVFLLHADFGQSLGNVHIDGKLLHSIDGGLAVLQLWFVSLGMDFTGHMK